jgi:hypothetical protein
MKHFWKISMDIIWDQRNPKQKTHQAAQVPANKLIRNAAGF